MGDQTIDLHQDIRINGVKLSFEELKYYVSEIQLLDVDGSNCDQRGIAVLIENLRNIEFIFGLDSILAFEEGHQSWDPSNEGMSHDHPSEIIF